LRSEAQVAQIGLCGSVALLDSFRGGGDYFRRVGQLGDGSGQRVLVHVFDETAIGFQLRGDCGLGDALGFDFDRVRGLATAADTGEGEDVLAIVLGHGVGNLDVGLVGDREGFLAVLVGLTLGLRGTNNGGLVVANVLGANLIEGAGFGQRDGVALGVGWETVNSRPWMVMVFSAASASVAGVWFSVFDMGMILWVVCAVARLCGGTW